MEFKFKSSEDKVILEVSPHSLKTITEMISLIASLRGDRTDYQRILFFFESIIKEIKEEKNSSEV